MDNFANKNISAIPEKEMNYDFWSGWENLTEIEKSAIEKTKLARKLLIESVPEEKLVAIYIKGSLTRRETKEGSDIDVVPIVVTDEDKGYAWETNVPEVEPAIIVPMSLEELRDNEDRQEIPEGEYRLACNPDRFLKFIGECKLIHGEPLNPNNFEIRSDEQAYKDEINTIKNNYIPAYLEGKCEFDGLLKEVFWLTELEQTLAGNKPKHSFKDIADSVSDYEHVIHDAYKLRQNKDSANLNDFINKLKLHLDKLSSEIGSN